MAQIKEFEQQLEGITYEVRKFLVGQDEMFDSLMTAILTGGHVLLEGAPGLAKTLTIKTLAGALGLPFKRIQFTPDLLPSDIIGTEIYDQKNQQFITNQGPIFANIVLADEINRAPAKVQSALLEAMQEKQVTIGRESFKLDEPFLVLATQNPIEQEGTYQLPEAQVDRFMMKVNITYPSSSDEVLILERNIRSEGADIHPVIEKEDIMKMIEFVKKEVYLDPELVKYIVSVNVLTRTLDQYPQLSDLAPYIEYGASPRGAIALAQVAKAHAFLAGRDYVTPEDVQKSAFRTLRHRIILSYEGVAEGIETEEIIDKILKQIQPPRIDFQQKLNAGVIPNQAVMPVPNPFPKQQLNTSIGQVQPVPNVQAN